MFRAVESGKIPLKMWRCFISLPLSLNLLSFTLLESRNDPQLLIRWDSFYTASVRSALLLAQGDVCSVSVPPLMGNTRSVFDRLDGVLAIGMVAPAYDLTLL